MVAKLRLEMDDKSPDKFKDLADNIEKTKEKTEELNEKTEELRSTNEILKEEISELNEILQESIEIQEDILIAQDQTNESVKEAGEEQSIVVGVLEVAATTYAKYRLGLLAAKTVAAGTTGAISGVAASVTATGTAATVAGLSMAAAAAPAVLLTTALVGVGFAARKVFENTGEMIDLTKVSNEHMELASELVRKYGTDLEKIQEELTLVGLTVEQLGIATTTNWDRMGDSMSRLASKTVDPFRDIGRGIREWWNSTNIFMDLWKEFEVVIDDVADTHVRAMEGMGDSIDHFRAFTAQAIGANREEYFKEIQTLRKLREETAKLAEIQEKQKPFFELLKNTNEALRKRLEFQKELRDISKISDLSGIQGARVDQQNTAATAASQFDIEGLQKHQQLMTAIESRGLQIRAQNQRKQDEDFRKDREEKDRRDERMLQKASERRAKWNERAFRLQKEENRIRLLTRVGIEGQQGGALRSGLLEALDAEISKIKEVDRLRKQLDKDSKERLGLIKKFEETKHNVTMRQIGEEIQARVQLAETDFEKQKITLDGFLRLADEEAAHKRLLRAMDHEQEMKKIQKEFELKSKKLQEFEQLKNQLQKQDATGASSATRLITDLDPRKVMKQFIDDRIEAAGGDDLTRRERSRVRTKASEEFRRGGAFAKGPAAQFKFQQQVRTAQKKQAVQTLQTLGKSGKLSFKQIKALEKATKELLNHEKELKSMEVSVEQIEKQLDEATSRGRRRRSQQSGTR